MLVLESKCYFLVDCRLFLVEPLCGYGQVPRLLQLRVIEMLL
jgi:hypothetical protein